MNIRFIYTLALVLGIATSSLAQENDMQTDSVLETELTGKEAKEAQKRNR